jgi:hypothetical protein
VRQWIVSTDGDQDVAEVIKEEVWKTPVPFFLMVRLGHCDLERSLSRSLPPFVSFHNQNEEEEEEEEDGEEGAEAEGEETEE